MNDAPKIIIAGASGYIGTAIVSKLLERFPNAQITALSRSAKVSDDPRIVWKSCDLFSLSSLEDAVGKDADLALYLVHSMAPTAHLDQGSFCDYDVLLADNFARTLKKRGVRQLIYLGGLIPNVQKLSPHLQSRLEVEETFTQHGVPTTVFRAGLIIGKGGSSFQILLKLVNRLPVMFCPAWTQSLTTPVDLDTVLDSIVAASLTEKCIGQVYDLAGCEPLTYVEMMRETARQLGKKRYFLAIPFFTPTLSRLWVSLITNSPKDLVYPLIGSLEHSMLARDSHLFSQPPNKTYAELLRSASLKIQPSRSIFHFQPSRKTVRSVQRLSLPLERNAEWVKDRYVDWLPKFLRSLVRAQREGDDIVLYLLTPKLSLLRLRAIVDQSDTDIQLLRIVSGLLVARNRGCLEFRVVLNRRYVIAAIHDYTPSLPWFIYRHTQAKIHLYVMRAFGAELSKVVP